MADTGLLTKEEGKELLDALENMEETKLAAARSKSVV